MPVCRLLGFEALPAAEKTNGAALPFGSAALKIMALFFAYLRPNILPGHFGFYLQVTAHRGGNAAKSCNGAKVYARLYLLAKG